MVRRRGAGWEDPDATRLAALQVRRVTACARVLVTRSQYGTRDSDSCVNVAFERAETVWYGYGRNRAVASSASLAVRV